MRDAKQETHFASHITYFGLPNGGVMATVPLELYELFEKKIRKRRSQESNKAC